MIHKKMLFGLTTSIKGVVGMKNVLTQSSDFLGISSLCDLRLTSLLFPKPFSSGCFKTMTFFNPLISEA